MSDDVVIRVEGLGKKYVIGHQAARENYVALRDVIARAARNTLRKTADIARGRAVVAGDATEDFWALKDVSFEVKRGEALGIIGRNGAGKSTLLKILSRITEPTEGRVCIKGRVASLLEVGTGFHPELTGRENIYLNGAILGMTRREIKKKFDEIVAFAEIEKFLDTPVKRYSSGMYVRLAFAVAAHLEPEILVVDEVLAVGDAEFQKKCLGKMGEVAGQGRTVLFVSHNAAAIENLCLRCILLAQGQVSIDATPSVAMSAYLMQRRASITSRDTQSALVKEVRVLDSDGGALSAVGVGHAMAFEVSLHTLEPLAKPRLSVNVLGPFANRLACFSSDIQTNGLPALHGQQRILIDIESIRLVPGSYPIEVALWDGDREVETCLIGFDLQIEEADFHGTGNVPSSTYGGWFVHPARWRVI